MKYKNKNPQPGSHNPVRRNLCQLGVLAGLGTSLPVLAQSPDRLRPQAGDVLVFDGGSQDGQPVTVEALMLNAQPVAAFPRQADSGIVRSRSRLNRVMVMRLDPKSLDTATLANSADGVIAYSAVCTHAGCDVFNWKPDELRMACPCHESEFSVRENGQVVGGPALLPLAMLPLQIAGGVVVVRDVFTGSVGFQQEF